MMPKEVRSAAEATQIAQSVLEAEYGFRRPVKAQKVGDILHVQIDVGVYKPQVANFQVDAKTGVVLEYEVSLEGS